MEISSPNSSLKIVRQSAINCLADKKNNALDLGLDVAGLEVDLLLTKTLEEFRGQKVTRTSLLVMLNEEIGSDFFDSFTRKLDRRLKGEPIEYILNLKEFYGNEIFVDARVLIPRPETELLVSKSLEIISENAKDNFCLLEAGVGSGAVIGSLARELKKSNEINRISKIAAFDVSQGALEVAKLNFDSLVPDLNIDLFKCSMFEFSFLSFVSDNKADNYIYLSNPPYLDSADEEISKSVKEFEPELALFSEDAGFSHIEKLINVFTDGYDTCKQLKIKANLLLEIGYNQGDRVKTLAKKWPYLDCQVLKDLSDHDRVLWLSFQ